MNKKLKTVIAIIITLLLFVGVYFLYKNLSEKYAPDSLITESNKNNTSSVSSEQSGVKDTNNPAPDFTVTNITGNKIKLSDLRGKPVVLNFWATWCYYCKVEMPDFEKMYKKYGDTVQFVMVNLTDGQRETVDVAKKHIDTNGFTFPIYFDIYSQAENAYNISGIPATYFIDSSGNIVSHANGMLDADSLEKGIDSVINKN